MVPAAFGFWVVAQLGLAVYVFMRGGVRNGLIFAAVALVSSYLWHFVTGKIPQAVGIWIAILFHVGVLFLATRWLVH